MQNLDAIIIGAGPYGLSAAAHFRSERGLNYRIFGEPMEFWERNMPGGMFLRSSWEASQIAAPPNKQLTLETYMAASGTRIADPIPVKSFVAYGRWFQQQTAADVDRRKIKSVAPNARGFAVTTNDGETLNCRKVIVAAGIAPFARLPEEFAGLPPEMASHSSRHTGFEAFSGKRVFVVGSGQSALETAALLKEAGADVEVIVRRARVHWLRWRNKITRRKLLGRLIYSPRDVGPPGISQLVARPDYLRWLPRSCQDWIGRRSIRPAGAAWLADRVKGIPIRHSLRVSSAARQNGHLRLTLSDGREERTDHLLLATGYKINVAKYGFLSPEIVSRLELRDGFPKLRAGLESSVPGLYFLGAPAAWTFGPVARFVSGAFYCVPTMAKHVVHRLQTEAA